MLDDGIGNGGVGLGFDAWIVFLMIWMIGIGCKIGH